ncbi:MAG: hypothetical protein ACYDHP_13115 [Ferrimicrobium sp.]
MEPSLRRWFAEIGRRGANTATLTVSVVNLPTQETTLGIPIGLGGVSASLVVVGGDA